MNDKNENSGHYIKSYGNKEDHYDKSDRISSESKTILPPLPHNYSQNRQQTTPPPTPKTQRRTTPNGNQRTGYQQTTPNGNQRSTSTGNQRTGNQWTTTNSNQRTTPPPTPNTSNNGARGYQRTTPPPTPQTNNGHFFGSQQDNSSDKTKKSFGCLAYAFMCFIIYSMIRACA